MARAHDKTFLQNFRFHATATLPDDSGDDPIGSAEDPDRSEAGFQTFGIPEYSIESVEYRDGLRLYTLKQPGTPETNEITAERGVIKRDASFLQWALRYLSGQEFYADIKLRQWNQDAAPHGPASGAALGTESNRNPDEARTYILHNCFPTNVIPASDLDADSSDISIKELSFEFEWWHLVLDPAANERVRANNP